MLIGLLLFYVRWLYWSLLCWGCSMLYVQVHPHLAERVKKGHRKKKHEEHNSKGCWALLFDTAPFGQDLINNWTRSGQRDRDLQGFWVQRPVRSGCPPPVQDGLTADPCFLQEPLRCSPRYSPRRRERFGRSPRWNPQAVRRGYGPKEHDHRIAWSDNVSRARQTAITSCFVASSFGLEGLGCLLFQSQPPLTLQAARYINHEA